MVEMKSGQSFQQIRDNDLIDGTISIELENRLFLAIKSNVFFYILFF